MWCNVGQEYFALYGESSVIILLSACMLIEIIFIQFSHQLVRLVNDAFILKVTAISKNANTFCYLYIEHFISLWITTALQQHHHRQCWLVQWPIQTCQIIKCGVLDIVALINSAKNKVTSIRRFQKGTSDAVKENKSDVEASAVSLFCLIELTFWLIS